MKSKWSDKEARSFIRRYGNQNIGEDLALRVYTSRLLGADPALVLHGGGNTSVKTVVQDALGRATEVLCVKGSGWDMADIEPAGLPAVRLAPVRELRALDRLSDEDMVNAQRVNLLDAGAPTPSVETLLHAFLPAKFVDHTHSTAVLSVSDQSNGDAICRRIYGKRMGYVPYIMPGFALAKAAAEVFERNPAVEGLILEKHGIFTFGASAREAYERMIKMVSLAEARLRARRKARIFTPGRMPSRCASVAEVAPILRGLLAERKGEAVKRMVLDFRTSPAIRAYVDGRDLARYSQQGVVTPDHTIRTKNQPVIVPAPAADKLDQFRAGSDQAFAQFTSSYHAYFSRNNKRLGGIKTELDPMPRVILVPGLGLFGVGAGAAAARIAADIAVSTVATITDAEAIGRFNALPERDLFDMEYWSLEQAKLGKGTEPRLARHVVVVTGAASGIGRATARAFRKEGAEVALLDLDASGVEAAAKSIGGKAFVCDVTKAGSVRAGFAAVAATFGGIDIVVSNAGRAWQGRIGDVDEKILHESFELNFYGHQRVAQAAVAVMRAQRTGGALLFNISKQALNPGPDFGPYGLPKAAALALMRQYAIDHGGEGIRANAVNADRIRSGLLTDTMIAKRAKARGLSKGDYMSGNLLHREVLAEDVAKAFVDLALSPKTTGGIVTVDGGNIAAAPR
jgi:rhamnose utilization protein RhaD (predicted bifunctional aldolase and dehydrogenase)/NAD(P)-dependent dehydrogenase (short-subunit alcohol dehydrogenase family)